MEHDKDTQVIDEYIITEDTLAILPVKHIEYSSVVYELGEGYYVRQTPMQIIKASCKAYHSSYDGRREATISLTNAKYKSPIIIRERDDLLAFPTISPKKFECAWILATHIKTIENPNNESCIIFNNGFPLTLAISFHCLQSQLNTTQHLHYLLTKETSEQKTAKTDLYVRLSQKEAEALALLKELLDKL